MAKKQFNDDGHLKVTAIQLVTQVEGLDGKDLLDVAKEVYEWLEVDFEETAEGGSVTSLHSIN